MYPEVLWIVIVSLVVMTVGYYVGTNINIVLNRTRKVNKTSYKYNPRILRKIAIFFCFIGIASHIYYYLTHAIVSYADGYTVGRGSGYITIFFNFWILGMILLEYLSVEEQNSFIIKWGSRLCILLYCLLYLFVFMKRRQVILLLLSLLATWNEKISRTKKTLIYGVGIVGIILFSIFGKVRGYFDTYGFYNLAGYVQENFSMDWLSLGELEGKYISRTLNDVYGYVNQNSIDPSILLGILFCMVPRKLLGGNKPLAFPEWYTKHFYPTDYARGTGYAGSMIGELYLIGGIFLVVFGYFFIGYVCARIQKKGFNKQNIHGRLVYSLFIYTILLLPRYDLASLLIDITFFYIPLILCMRFARVNDLD
jgi:oligosaccharide repeat unit polymerase